MKRKIIVLAVAFLSLAMLATPVIAIGPENALGKNPNLIGPAPWGFDMVLGNGVVHGWITISPIPKTELLLDARSFKIKNAFVVTDAVQVDGMENKWLFLSQSIWYDFLILQGMSPSMAAYLASLHPEGLYFKWNYVSK